MVLKVNLFSDAVHIPNIHEQEDGSLLACCATGTSSKDSLLSWVRFLQRDNPELKDVPILFCTVRSAVGRVSEGLNSGGDDYVVKPFSPREVVERVKAILRRTHTREDFVDLTAVPKEGGAVQILCTGARPLGRIAQLRIIVDVDDNCQDVTNIFGTLVVKETAGATVPKA